jgi:hypothetical protein
VPSPPRACTELVRRIPIFWGRSATKRMPRVGLETSSVECLGHCHTNLLRSKLKCRKIPTASTATTPIRRKDLQISEFQCGWYCGRYFLCGRCCFSAGALVEKAIVGKPRKENPVNMGFWLLRSLRSVFHQTLLHSVFLYALSLHQVLYQRGRVASLFLEDSAHIAKK